MPRVRWCPLPSSILCLIISVLFFSTWILTVHADCWYDDERHDEGGQVPTVEPCLNCTCSRGALLCYLRVCPKLPDPPPSGCILLHRFRTCCPELICTDIPNGENNGLEARSEPDGLADVPYDRTILKNACMANGSVYGPGSAMASSSSCEYCYCLGGKQMCVKPKCLIPIDGCTPHYHTSTCCPIQYNCTRSAQISSTTESVHRQVREGCLVDGVHYNEGGKVLGVGHSVCDNCYCLGGVLRCEPLSCAPPLLGCSPVIKPGECCAASYNCSGTIEIQAVPNYGQYPTVSKEYAKLRKEVQNGGKKTADGPFYVIAETSTDSNRRTGGTTRHFPISNGLSTSKPFYYNAMMEESLLASENKHSTRSYAENKFPNVYFATSNYEFQNTNYRRPVATTEVATSTTKRPSTNTEGNKIEENLPSTDFLSDDTILSLVDSLLLESNRLNRRIDNETTTEMENTSFTESPTTVWEETSTLESTTHQSDYTVESESTMSTEMVENPTTENENASLPLTVKTVLNSTECSDDSKVRFSPELSTVIPVDANEINKLAEVKEFESELYTTSSEESSETTTNTIKIFSTDASDGHHKISTITLRNVGSIPPEIEALLNISKSKDNDYEYDYNEPSLPPSLPNLRIIPFVAADALDSKKEIKDKIDMFNGEPEFGYQTNLFSPPTETEGGFVPKEPPIMDNFYENAVTAPSITNSPNKNEASCLSNGRKILHGQSVTSESPCITCSCFYGNVLCQKPNCPVPRPACRKSTVQDLTTCCPQYVCDDEEAPTVVLDRHEGTSNSQDVVTVAEGVVTPDPFRDVIRTEPPPNLQSLMVDMMPFLARKTTPLNQLKSSTTTTNRPTSPDPTTSPIIAGTTITNDDFSLDKVLQFLFAGEKQETTTTTENPVSTTEENQLKIDSNQLNITERLDNNIVNSSSENEISTPGVGLLKLAGCNIYGQMYRVGRIISELSGPCLECKCTEIGVQCNPLKC